MEYNGGDFMDLQLKPNFLATSNVFTLFASKYPVAGQTLSQYSTKSHIKKITVQINIPQKITDRKVTDKNAEFSKQAVNCYTWIFLFGRKQERVLHQLTV